MAFTAVGSFIDPSGRKVYYDNTGAQSLQDSALDTQNAGTAKDDWMSNLGTTTGSAPQGFNWQNYVSANKDLGAAGIDTYDEALRHYQNFGIKENRNLGGDTTQAPPAAAAPATTQPTSTSSWTADQQKAIATKWNDPNVDINAKADWLRQNSVTSAQLADILKSQNQAYTQDTSNLDRSIEMALAKSNGYKRGDFGTLLGMMDMYGVQAYKPTTAAEYAAQIAQQNAAAKAEWDRGVRAGPVSATDTFKPATLASTATGNIDPRLQTIRGGWLDPNKPMSTKMQEMSQYGVGVQDIMAATGQTLEQVAAALKAGGAKEGFAGLHWNPDGTLFGTDWGGPIKPNGAGGSTGGTNGGNTTGGNTTGGNGGIIAGTQGIQPYSQWNVDPSTQTVAGQLQSIMNPNNPLMQQAQTQGLQIANDRGLINSSMAQTAAQDAMLRQALQIAGPDAATYAKAGQFNTSEANQFARDNNLTQYDLQKMGVAHGYDLENAQNAFTNQSNLQASAGAESRSLGFQSAANNIMTQLSAQIASINANTSITSKEAKAQMIAWQKEAAKNSMTVLSHASGDVDVSSWLDQIFDAPTA